MSRLFSTQIKPQKNPEKTGYGSFKKIYEVDPLIFQKCSGKMKVISVIEDADVIKKILKHLGLWDRKARPPRKPTSPQPIDEYSIVYSESQLSEFTRHHSGGSDNLSRAPSWNDDWLYVDAVYPED